MTQRRRMSGQGLLRRPSAGSGPIGRRDGIVVSSISGSCQPSAHVIFLVVLQGLRGSTARRPPPLRASVWGFFPPVRCQTAWAGTVAR